MISVTEAQKMLLESISKGKIIEIDVRNSLGYLLAQDFAAPIDLPPFSNSAMDGYAFDYNEIHFTKNYGLKIIGEIKAGQLPNINVAKGEAVRIFTGAPIPKGASVVVKQEDTNEIEGKVFVKSKVKSGDNIRKKGHQIKKGTCLSLSGKQISPAIIGYLSSLGIKKTKVFKKPAVSIIVIGSELIEPGKKLRNGQIYESNSFALKAALLQMGIKPKFVKNLPDDKETINKAFENILPISDVVIFSGGISVGKYDYVRELIEEWNISKVFYKVAQKPGKPLFFGKKDGRLIFGLPGNPCAAITCFYEYVYPALRKIEGYNFENFLLPSKKLPLLEKNIVAKGNRTTFFKGKVNRNNEGVYVLDGQGSDNLRSFAEADCLIKIDSKEDVHLNKGEMVEVHLLPFSQPF